MFIYVHIQHYTSNLIETLKHQFLTRSTKLHFRAYVFQTKNAFKSSTFENRNIMFVFYGTTIISDIATIFIVWGLASISVLQQR